MAARVAAHHRARVGLAGDDLDHGVREVVLEAVLAHRAGQDLLEAGVLEQVGARGLGGGHGDDRVARGVGQSSWRRDGVLRGGCGGILAGRGGPRSGELTMRSPLARRMCAALLLLAGCATVPGTGRSQFRFIPLETEMSLGEEGYQSELQDATLITSGADYEMVQRVGQRIAAAATELYPEPSAQFEWEVKLIDDPKTVNAWCLPGGKIAVYSGLLPVTQNEEALAIVVGHEVGHAVARHGSERMSQDLTFSAILGATAVSLSDMKPEQRDLVMGALIGGGTLAVLYPYSRTQE